MHTLTPLSAGQLPFDRSWFLHVNAFARDTPWLHEPARVWAQYGVVVFAALLLWSWWSARARRDVRAVAAALWAPIGTLLAVGLNQLVGGSVDEARPYAVLPHVLVLVSRTSDFSFPSDHAVMAGVGGRRRLRRQPAPGRGGRGRRAGHVPGARVRRGPLPR